MYQSLFCPQAWNTLSLNLPWIPSLFSSSILNAPLLGGVPSALWILPIPSHQTRPPTHTITHYFCPRTLPFPFTGFNVICNDEFIADTMCLRSIWPTRLHMPWGQDICVICPTNTRPSLALGIVDSWSVLMNELRNSLRPHTRWGWEVRKDLHCSFPTITPCIILLKLP